MKNSLEGIAVFVKFKRQKSTANRGHWISLNSYLKEDQGRNLIMIDAYMTL